MIDRNIDHHAQRPTGSERKKVTFCWGFVRPLCLNFPVTTDYRMIGLCINCPSLAGGARLAWRVNVDLVREVSLCGITRDDRAL